MPAVWDLPRGLSDGPERGRRRRHRSHSLNGEAPRYAAAEHRDLTQSTSRKTFDGKRSLHAAGGLKNPPGCSGAAVGWSYTFSSLTAAHLYIVTAKILLEAICYLKARVFCYRATRVVPWPLKAYRTSPLFESTVRPYEARPRCRPLGPSLRVARVMFYRYRAYVNRGCCIYSHSHLLQPR